MSAPSPADVAENHRSTATARELGNSAARMLTETESVAIKPLRYDRKVTDSRRLYLLVGRLARARGGLLTASRGSTRRPL